MSYPPEPPQPGYGQPYPPPYRPPHATPTNGKATASLITGVASLVLSWCPGLGILGAVAVYLGVRARAEIRSGGSSEQGDGLALGGMVTGAIAVVLGLLLLTLIVIAIVTNTHFETSSQATMRL